MGSMMDMEYDIIVNEESLETFVELADKIFGYDSDLYQALDEERRRGKGYLDREFFCEIYEQILAKKNVWYMP